MSVLNAFPDKTECPLSQCDYRHAPEEKGLCTRKKCPFPQNVRDRWLDQQAAEQAAMGELDE